MRPFWILDFRFGGKSVESEENCEIKETTRISLGVDPKIENPKPKIQNRDGLSRRDFLSTVALAGTGALLGLRSDSLAAEPPPETTRTRV